MRPSLCSALAALLLAAAPLAAQSPAPRPAAPAPAADPAADRAAVVAVVTRLFDAMRAGDSAAARAVFVPGAQLATTTNGPAGPALRVDSLEAFVRVVGTPRADVLDERLRNPVVHVDGGLAVVWVDYSLWVGPRFSHCGVDAFQLARTAGGWKVFALADTRRRTGCPDAPPAAAPAR